MTRTEAARRLRELAHEIYDTLEEMEDILREVAPEELETARAYWMGHIDGALLNIKGQIGGSFTSLGDTLTILEEEGNNYPRRGANGLVIPSGQSPLVPFNPREIFKKG